MLILYAVPISFWPMLGKEKWYFLNTYDGCSTYNSVMSAQN